MVSCTRASRNPCSGPKYSARMRTGRPSSLSRKAISVYASRPPAVCFNATSSPRSPKINEAARRIRIQELHSNLISHLHAVCALDHLALGYWVRDPHPGPLVGGSGDHGVELPPDPRCQQEGSGGFLHQPLHLFRVVFLRGAVLGEGLELRQGISGHASRERRLQNALRDDIREAAVRSGGVRVIADREAEVPGRRSARSLDL